MGQGSRHGPRPSLVADIADGLAAIDPRLGFEVGPPRGGAWYRLDEVASRGHIARWFEELVDGRHRERLPRQVAGAYLGSWLSAALVAPAVTAYLLQRRVLDLSLRHLYVHRDGEGWFDRLATSASRVVLLSDDPAAGEPHAVVARNFDEVRRSLATGLVAALIPLLTAVRRASPYGWRGLWGSVADHVAEVMWVLAEQRADADTAGHAWVEVQCLLDEIAAEVGPAMTSRPKLVQVHWSGGITLLTARGTCCLYCRTPDAVVHTVEDRYCTSCPLRPDADREAKWAHWFETREYGGAG